MATVSQMTATLTSPAYVWEDALPAETEALHDEQALLNDQSLNALGRLPLASQNGNSTMRSVTNPEVPSQSYSDEEPPTELNDKILDATHPPQHDYKDQKPHNINGHANPEISLEQYGATNGERERVEDAHKRGPAGRPPNLTAEENSKWIHRDKLARIESEELQAAGIFLPRQRDRVRSKSQNRPRRDQSQDKMNGSGGRSIGGSEHTANRSRKNSAATTTDTKTLDLAIIPSWDLRRPQEILEEGDAHSLSNGSGKGSSRIPVAKGSPVPIPSEHLARDTRLPRKRDGSPGAEDTITYPKLRARSGSASSGLAKAAGMGPTPQPNKRPDSSPKKPTAISTTRKPKPANGAAGRPKTRGGPSKDSTSSGTGTTRPSTRSGEREFSTSSNSKPMEGEPPWMVSAYRPDPRLPPDQQLLPTVAKRLQQEKWEREGKFGSIYDKEFRPLTDEGFLKPPEPSAQDKEDEKEAETGEPKEERGDWPLKGEPKSPSLPGRTNSYSTMPRITDNPTANAQPSPRTPMHQTQPSQTVRVPEPLEEPQDKKAGCGCCIVM
ncbi:hypothetical protein C8A00DRAFT_40096 [Chaetomidium leptoderma]|uniref:TeaA receptor TeaR n=1 Tax=Chaetomidium leptoderma TaxID=669021 RepID=A0AAN7A251_9PEZI|nr:hypothetical protein C8A00DRAFT_40096 [Chaetomidium leptoderma]